MLKPMKNADRPPREGSIVLLHGESGTAYQRFYSDGKFHSVTGDVKTYAELFEASPHRAPLLVYAPPVEKEEV